MSDINANKETARAFLDLAFNQKKPEEAASQYMGSQYIQHNPGIEDGKEAFIGFSHYMISEFPELKINFKKAIAEGDHVVLYNHVVAAPSSPGMAVADIFRFEDGKIVEHWDVLQDVPTEAKNDNTMF